MRWAPPVGPRCLGVQSGPGQHPPGPPRDPSVHRRKPSAVRRGGGGSPAAGAQSGPPGPRLCSQPGLGAPWRHALGGLGRGRNIPPVRAPTGPGGRRQLLAPPCGSHLLQGAILAGAALSGRRWSLDGAEARPAFQPRLLAPAARRGCCSVGRARAASRWTIGIAGDQRWLLWLRRLPAQRSHSQGRGGPSSMAQP